MVGTSTQGAYTKTELVMDSRMFPGAPIKTELLVGAPLTIPDPYRRHGMLHERVLGT